MSKFRFDKALRVARGVKAFLQPQGSIAGEEPQLRASEYSKKIKSKKRKLSRIDKKRRKTKNKTVLAEHRRKRKQTQQEIFHLQQKLRAAQNGVVGEYETGALPDFVIIGVRKAGTTFLYNLLTRHPYVEPAAAKEVHYFDTIIEKEDVGWYSRCFPSPQQREGRKTITGEATPEYLTHPLVPKRMAEVIPQARLIALLRNPIDRAYSDYQHVVHKGREPLTFDEAVRLEEAVMGGLKPRPSGKPSGKRSDTTEGEDGGVGLGYRRGYLSKGIYVDHLKRWRGFYAKEQLLVLKSEELFERTPETLKLVLDFLELPEPEHRFWEEKPVKRNQGKYVRDMEPATRRRLEHFFEPHNRRLYEYLGVDLGW